MEPSRMRTGRMDQGHEDREPATGQCASSAAYLSEDYLSALAITRCEFAIRIDVVGAWIAHAKVPLVAYQTHQRIRPTEEFLRIAHAKACS